MIDDQCAILSTGTPIQVLNPSNRPELCRTNLNRCFPFGKPPTVSHRTIGNVELALKNQRKRSLKGCRDDGGGQVWRSGRLPMLPGFDSQIRRHRWVEFVGSLLGTVRVFPGTPVSPFLIFSSIFR